MVGEYQSRKYTQSFTPGIAGGDQLIGIGESGKAAYHQSTTSFVGDMNFRVSPSARDGAGVSMNHRNEAWLIEAIRKATMDLYEGTILMLESAVHNMSEAQDKLN